MRIVIFHGRLTVPTGGEVNTRDWALGLKARGHRVVVFTIYPGPLAEEIRNAGIAVVDNPSSISDTPDILFGAGINDLATLLARFPEVPAIQVAQIWDHWNAYPCPLPQIVLHVAVDELNTEMLINEFGVPRERVRLVYNAVDTARLPVGSKPLPQRPARALIFAKSETAYVETVRAACAARSILADAVGHPFGRPLDHPLKVMVDYDLVIGSARTALEGAVAGSAVLVADHRGLAGMLTTGNLDHFRRNNFGRELLTRPLDIAEIGAEIDRYDPADANAVSQTLRRDATLDRQIDRLEAIFGEAIDLFKRSAPSADESRKALAAYLAAHLPRPAAGDPSPRHVRFPPNPWIDEKLANIERRLSAAAEQTAALGQQTRATADSIPAMEQRLSAIPEQLSMIEGRLSGTERHVSATAERLPALDQRFSTTAEHISATDQRMADMAEHLSTLDQRFSTTADHISEMDRRIADMAEHLSAIRQRLSPAEINLEAAQGLISATSEHLSAIDQRCATAEGQISVMDHRVSAAAQRTAAMDQRLSTIEDAASAMRPLVRILRPLALALSRVRRGLKQFTVSASSPPRG